MIQFDISTTITACETASVQLMRLLLLIWVNRITRISGSYRSLTCYLLKSGFVKLPHSLQRSKAVPSVVLLLLNVINRMVFKGNGDTKRAHYHCFATSFMKKSVNVLRFSFQLFLI